MYIFKIKVKYVVQEHLSDFYIDVFRNKHDAGLCNVTFTFTFMPWRRKWQPTPVFLPGESLGRGSLVGCRLWGHTVGHDWSDLAAAAVVKEPACQCRRHGFDPWVGKIPWKRARQLLQYTAWRIAWVEELNKLLSIGSQRVGHDWSNLAHRNKTFLWKKIDWLQK